MSSKRQILETKTITAATPHSIDPIILIAMRFFIYSLIMGGMVVCLTWEAKKTPIDILFNEHSLLEFFQEGSLLLSALICFLIARLDRDRITLAVILGGAALVALIREFDSFLDTNVFDGSWQLLVVLTLSLVGFKLYTLRHTLRPSISDFVNRPSFGIMISGFMTVFVFSRLFGRTVFWEAVMGDHYLRAVKNLAEEGSELLGYLLILIGVVELFVDLIIHKPAVGQKPVTDLNDNS